MKKQFALVALFSVTMVGCSSDESEKAAPITSNTENVTPVTQSQPAVSDVKLPETAAPVQISSAPAEKPVTKVESVQTKKVYSGERLYATCVGCHGASGEGGVGPRLRGQTIENLVEKMTGYKEGKTYGPMTSMMSPNVQNMSAAEIESVSKYIAAMH